MSSSERSSSGESDDESLLDLQKLKPYEILSLDGISTSSDEEELSSSDCEAESRIGKTYSYYISTFTVSIIKQKSSLKNMGQAQKFQEFTSFGFNKISLVSELLLYHVLILLYCVFIICTLLKNSHSQTLSSRKYIKVIN